MPSIDNESPSGRYLGEEVTEQFGLEGTELEGTRMFNEQFDPKFVASEELILTYAEYLGIDLSNPEEMELIEIAKEGLMMPFDEEQWKIMIL